MAQVILVTSGKGGAGKSTVCALLGDVLARKHEKRVLLIEASQRALDVLLGLDGQVVFDLRDLLEESCRPDEAILSAGREDRLNLLCAPSDGALDAVGRLPELLDILAQYFDYILIEAGGQEKALLQLLAPLCDSAILVSAPDRASARACRTLSDRLAREGAESIRLCINFLPHDFCRTRPVPDLDWMIDTVCAQLIAVILWEPALVSLRDIEHSIQSSNASMTIFENFAQRILGNYIDLWVW